MNRVAMDAAAGAAGGLAGTVAMSVVMLAARQSGFLGEAPPRRITDRLLEGVGLGHLDRRAKDAIAVASHMAYGIGFGALFGLARRRLPERVPPAAAGALAGLAVWVASYEGWVPALGLMPPPERDRPGRPTSMVVAHLVYGAVAGAVAQRIGA